MVIDEAQLLVEESLFAKRGLSCDFATLTIIILANIRMYFLYAVTTYMLGYKEGSEESSFSADKWLNCEGGSNKAVSTPKRNDFYIGPSSIQARDSYIYIYIVLNQRNDQWKGKGNN